MLKLRDETKRKELAAQKFRGGNCETRNQLEKQSAMCMRISSYNSIDVLCACSKNISVCV